MMAEFVSIPNSNQLTLSNNRIKYMIDFTNKNKSQKKLSKFLPKNCKMLVTTFKELTSSL